MRVSTQFCILHAAATEDGAEEVWEAKKEKRKKKKKKRKKKERDGLIDLNSKGNNDQYDFSCACIRSERLLLTFPPIFLLSTSLTSLPTTAYSVRCKL